MTHLHKKQCLQNCLNRLCKEFEVPKPFFRIPDEIEWNREKVGGYYNGFPPCITLNPRFYNNDIGTALRIVRHEFGHYLCERHDKPDGQERNCIKFEKNLFALKIMPKFQTTLDNFCFLTHQSE